MKEGEASEKQANRPQSSKTVCSSPSQVYLRVSNLKLPTKAADLKQLFNPCGKVLSGKILTSARTPGDCIGFLRMASADDAAKCVKSLDGSEFNGRKIKVEVTDRMPSSISKVSKSGVDASPCGEKKKKKASGLLTKSSSRRYHAVGLAVGGGGGGGGGGRSALYSVRDHDFGRCSRRCGFATHGVRLLARTPSKTASR